MSSKMELLRDDIFPLSSKYDLECEYVGGIRHPGAVRLDSSGGEIRHLRRQDWTLTT